MNRLELLPTDVSEYIYQMRDAGATIQIQEAWRAYQVPKNNAKTSLYNMGDICRVGRLTEIEMLRWGEDYVVRIAWMMEYLAVVLSGREKRSVWLIDILDIEEGLMAWAESGWPRLGYRALEFYRRIEIAINTIRYKFAECCERRGW